jgi:hypothetical protein
MSGGFGDNGHMGMRLGHAWLGSLVVLIACSGASSTVGGDGGSTGDASGSSSGGADASMTDSGGGDAGPCPDISGAFGQIATSGQGCGDINASAPECIMLAQQICAFQLVSAPTTGKAAVNGVVDLQSDASFSGAALQEGTVQRTGCTGQWSAASQTLTLDCGGMGSSQSCIVTMTRTGSTCQ